MRLDPVHVKKLSRAIDRSNGNSEVNLDVGFMVSAMERLSLWERGLLLEAVMRAGKTKRPSLTQRALLALFVNNEEGDPQ